MNGFDVVIFGGQSNMQGQSEALLSREPVPSAFEYKFLSDEIVPLRDPAGEDIRRDGTAGYPFREGTELSAWLADHAAGSACYGHTSLIPAFCARCAALTGRRVLAVPCAKGSTGIADWLPGTDGWRILAGKTAGALRRVRKTSAAASVSLVWLQGESDAIAGRSKAYYKEKLRSLADALARDAGVERAGIIRVGHFTHDARDGEIIEAQRELCREDARFWLLTELADMLEASPGYMNPHVGGHFGARGLMLLGKAAGEALARVLPGRETA